MEQLIPALAEARRANTDLAAVRLRAGAQPADLPQRLPAELLRLLALSDGLTFGVRAKIWPGNVITGQQYTDTLGEAAGIDNAGDYLTIGDVFEDPLLFDTTDGSIWVARADGGLWYQACRLERIAGGLDEFLAEWVASPRFQELVDLTDAEDRERDDWWKLLKAAGRVPAV